MNWLGPIIILMQKHSKIHCQYSNNILFTKIYWNLAKQWYFEFKSNSSWVFANLGTFFDAKLKTIEINSKSLKTLYLFFTNPNKMWTSIEYLYCSGICMWYTKYNWANHIESDEYIVAYKQWINFTAGHLTKPPFTIFRVSGFCLLFTQHIWNEYTVDVAACFLSLNFSTYFEFCGWPWTYRRC